MVVCGAVSTVPVVCGVVLTEPLWLCSVVCAHIRTGVLWGGVGVGVPVLCGVFCGARVVCAAFWGAAGVRAALSGEPVRCAAARRAAGVGASGVGTHKGRAWKRRAALVCSRSRMQKKPTCASEGVTLTLHPKSLCAAGLGFSPGVEGGLFGAPITACRFCPVLGHGFIAVARQTQCLQIIRVVRINTGDVVDLISWFPTQPALMIITFPNCCAELAPIPRVFVAGWHG